MRKCLVDLTLHIRKEPICAIREEVTIMNSNITVLSPVPYQVFQRSDDYVADIPIAGTYDGEGPVEYRIEGTDWQQADINDGHFSAKILNVPVGGPYLLELKTGAGAYVRIPDLLVGDLWVLAGQSNMDGCGKLINLETPHKMVHAFYYDETWGIARDPLCRLNESIDPVHWSIDDPLEREKLNRWNRNFGTIGASLGVRFGKVMYKATGVPVGLLVCSHGGTSLAQWDPALKHLGGRSLYGSMMRRISVAGGKVAGCLWYQGESDAISPERGVGYKEKFRQFIETVRSDLQSPEMPFVYVQLACFFGDEALSEGWNRVQTDQLALESELANVAMVPAIDSTLSDSIHLDSVSLRRLGERLAFQALRLRFGRTDILSGPRPKRIEFVNDSRTLLRIHFEGVHGALHPSTGRCGFTIDANGAPHYIVSWARAENDPTSIMITLEDPVPAGSLLWYGRGLNPPCELKDSQGFPVPVFGPVTI